MAWYPFDMYEVRMFVLVNTSMSPFNGQPQDPVDVSFVIVTPSNFDWNYRIKETYGDTAVAPGVYSITVEIKRQFNVYTALVFAGIWAVTVSIGYIGSCAVIWKRRAADNPVIYISALFAVPGFRNTLPGSPPYGCIFDILCTYFAIAVVLSFLVLVSVAYMKKAA
ncbi:hypothetical protein H310_14444 [Aphanomyces invadans]|uniref:Uncharacterized protein n=1 Tax=Aphanomyces invadans TaxID=157072 RepID=A0A024T9X4_9STRA|nr:hypothetical protein H310_14444 [Aphanomyces invadans]ETV90848.1 hypothetical protein H310_14444 [Aphanomyces invadans]|eukprot:XP_008880526.1 hypothetical protein H310_14444 [Aphanomyces invadans]